MLAVAAAVVALAGCTPTAEIRQHDEAVFGHFASMAQARAYARKPRAVGFKGVKVEDDGCGDYEVEIDGADTQKQRSSFAAEAVRARFPGVWFEQTGDPLHPPSGQTYGVLGRKATVTAANALAWNVAAGGFRYVDIVPSGGRWLVVMPQVPVANALSIAREVAKARFHIQFVVAK
jgi:hypothetical protein